MRDRKAVLVDSLHGGSAYALELASTDTIELLLVMIVKGTKTIYEAISFQVAFSLVSLYEL